jgi:hydroxymethylbilane synthase
MTQTKWVIKKLEEAGCPFQFEIKEIVTKGDRILDVTLSKVGGKGLFVKEIENALLNGTIDMAVHSMKDMPSSLPDGLTIGAVPKREDSRDALISKDHQTLQDLKPGSVIGTSSLRRSSQILSARPDLEIKWIRGNIDTRLKKLEAGDYDAIVLAAAGLSRMGWKDEMVTEFLDQEICLPAVGQGALSIECREDDNELMEQLAKLNDEYTSRTVSAERAFLEKLQGGCQIPIAGYAVMDDKGNLELTGYVGSPDGNVRFVEKTTGSDPAAVGVECAEIMIRKGAGELIAKVKEELDS